MKKGTDFLLLFLITFLSINLVFQSCQKEPNLTAQSSSSDSNSSVNDRGGDSLDYYKTMVAKCVARGLGDSNFKTFFNRVSVRGEGGQSGFSLWHYRDSLVTTSQTLASFLSVQAGYLGYSYNAQFFRGHLVRYIPNLAIGISIWGTSSVSTYVFASTTKGVRLQTDVH